MSERRAGLLQGVLAYGLWGIVAAYWKLLKNVDPIELIAHRALWGLVAFMVIVIAAGQWTTLRATLRDKQVVAVMTASGALLAVNWGVFVAATIHATCSKRAWGTSSIRSCRSPSARSCCANDCAGCNGSRSCSRRSALPC